jgi:beta-mannosidase
MTTCVNLSGEWTLRGEMPREDREWRLTGRVPGQVHLDLLREGHIPDPFWREQADACQWIEREEWVYEREFELAGDFDRSWAVLEFDGLDTFATITLNGAEVGRTANMFIPHAFEVGPLLREGTNRLRVRFDSIWKHVEGKRMDYPCAFENQERLHVRRMQCTFHWDWVNRFVTAGIWRPVRLVSYDRARVVAVGVWTERVSGVRGQEADEADIAVQLEAEIRTDQPVTACVEILDPSGRCAGKTGKQAAAGKANATDRCPPITDHFYVRIPDPRLWWPNGYGDQPLYTCRVPLSAADGTELDHRETTFGIRTVEVRQEIDRPGSPEAAMTRSLRERFPDRERNGDRPGSGFKLFVNGVEIFCKGGNWVPADPFPARITPEWYDRLIKLAADGNQNMLRCWGGGIYEPQGFWDACNRHGIMICQDFMTACAQYPEDDPDFMAAMTKEVPAAIRMLRNNPSLVWWYGDNENGMKFAEDDPACWGRRLFDEIIAPACRALDPSRPAFPTSPFGGNLNNSLTIGDCHAAYSPSSEAEFADGLRDYRREIDELTARFLSETQSYGPPAWPSLLRFMTEEDIADPANRVLEFHSKTNPYAKMTLIAAQFKRMEHLFGGPNGTPTLCAVPPVRPVVPTGRRGGGPVGTTGRTVRSHSAARRKIAFLEYAQYEWVRLIVEAQRRHRFYCGGVLFWMYNDCWPANGWSLIDYYGLPKAAWYAMKRACAPVITSILDAGDVFEVWVCNDSLEPARGMASLSVQPWQGPPRWQRDLPFDAPANQSTRVAAIRKSEIDGLDKDTVLVCDCAAHISWYYPGMPYEMTPPPAALAVERVSDDELSITADVYARVVTVEAKNAVFSDNYFDLRPGETRRIAWRHADPAVPVGEISVWCWNE